MFMLKSKDLGVSCKFFLQSAVNKLLIAELVYFSPYSPRTMFNKLSYEMLYEYQQSI